MVVLRYILLVVLGIFSIGGVRFTIFTLLGENAYNKDFMQEYLLVKAMAARVDPYSPFEILARQFLGSHPLMILPHPIPHPPPVAVFSLPLAALSYVQAAWAWYFIEIVCLVISAYLILGWLDVKHKTLLAFPLALFAFSWSPVVEDLSWGQFGSIILVLLLGTWMALRKDRQILAGALLGCILALKLFAWPVGLFLILQKKWRAVLSAICVVVLANFLAAVGMGFDRVLNYYTKVTLTITSLYRAHEGNFSLWTLGWRLFDGTGAPGLSGLSAPPLIHSPLLARLFWIGIPLLVLLLGFYLASRIREFDSTFAILILLSILLAPIVWIHYFVIALIPLLVLGRQLIAASLPKWETYVGVIIVLLITFPRQYINRILPSFQTSGTGGILNVTFIGSMTTLIPTFALVGLGVLIWYMCIKYDAKRDIPTDRKLAIPRE